MSEISVIEQIPIMTGPDGVMRVHGTRVTLDTIVEAFNEGATAEEIAQQYPSVSLADAYQVIGFYLRHSTELESYFVQRRRESGEARKLNHARSSPDGIRERLLARLKE